MELGLCIEFGPVRNDSVRRGGAPLDQIPLRRFTPSWTSTRVTCDCLLPFVHPLLSQVYGDTVVGCCSYQPCEVSNLLGISFWSAWIQVPSHPSCDSFRITLHLSSPPAPVVFRHSRRHSFRAMGGRGSHCLSGPPDTVTGQFPSFCPEA